MLDRDTIRRRLEGDGISYTEFSYMLLQANDYVQLHRKYGCSLQIGGSDQWGNIVAGVRLARQQDGASVHALTVPLVTAADGTKFGKSTGGGNLWLDPEMTSPYAWYQYFINTADADVVRYLRWFTFLSAEEIGELETATTERAHERAAQRRLAAEVTTLVHGESATLAVEHASGALFGRGDLDRLDEGTLTAALTEAGNGEPARIADGEPDTIVDLLVSSGLSESKGAARRTVKEGGVYVNNTRVDAEDWTPGDGDYLTGGWLVLRRGKRNIAGCSGSASRSLRYTHWGSTDSLTLPSSPKMRKRVKVRANHRSWVTAMTVPSKAARASSSASAECRSRLSVGSSSSSRVEPINPAAGSGSGSAARRTAS